MAASRSHAYLVDMQITSVIRLNTSGHIASYHVSKFFLKQMLDVCQADLMDAMNRNYCLPRHRIDFECSGYKLVSCQVTDSIFFSVQQSCLNYIKAAWGLNLNFTSNGIQVEGGYTQSTEYAYGQTAPTFSYPDNHSQGMVEAPREGDGSRNGYSASYAQFPSFQASHSYVQTIVAPGYPDFITSSSSSSVAENTQHCNGVQEASGASFYEQQVCAGNGLPTDYVEEDLFEEQLVEESEEREELDELSAGQPVEKQKECASAGLQNFGMWSSAISASSSESVSSVLNAEEEEESSRDDTPAMNGNFNS